MQIYDTFDANATIKMKRSAERAHPGMGVGRPSVNPKQADPDSAAAEMKTGARISVSAAAEMKTGARISASAAAEMKTGARISVSAAAEMK